MQNIPVDRNLSDCAVYVFGESARRWGWLGAEMAGKLRAREAPFKSYFLWLFETMPKESRYANAQTSEKNMDRYRAESETRCGSARASFSLDLDTLGVRVSAGTPPEILLASRREDFSALFRYVTARKMGFFRIVSDWEREAVVTLVRTPEFFSCVDAEYVASYPMREEDLWRHEHT